MIRRPTLSMNIASVYPHIVGNMYACGIEEGTRRTFEYVEKCGVQYVSLMAISALDQQYIYTHYRHMVTGYEKVWTLKHIGVPSQIFNWSLRTVMFGNDLLGIPISGGDPALTDEWMSLVYHGLVTTDERLPAVGEATNSFLVEMRKEIDPDVRTYVSLSQQGYGLCLDLHPTHALTVVGWEEKLSELNIGVVHFHPSVSDAQKILRGEVPGIQSALGVLVSSYPGIQSVPVVLEVNPVFDLLYGSEGLSKIVAYVRREMSWLE
ncbi:MAG: hypothetical protein WC243_03190 [Patescibacteria group bacterium]